jgi:hypothetical protein
VICAFELRGHALLNTPAILGCARKGEETEGGGRTRESSCSLDLSLSFRSSPFFDRSGRIAISLTTLDDPRYSLRRRGESYKGGFRHAVRITNIVQSRAQRRMSTVCNRCSLCVRDGGFDYLTSV